MLMDEWCFVDASKALQFHVEEKLIFYWSFLTRCWWVVDVWNPLKLFIEFSLTNSRCFVDGKSVLTYCLWNIDELLMKCCSLEKSVYFSFIFCRCPPLACSTEIISPRAKRGDWGIKNRRSAWQDKRFGVAAQGFWRGGDAPVRGGQTWRSSSSSSSLSVCLFRGELVWVGMSNRAKNFWWWSGTWSGTFISGTGPIGHGLGEKRAGNLNFARFYIVWRAMFGSGFLLVVGHRVLPGCDQVLPGCDQVLPGCDQVLPRRDQVLPRHDQVLPGHDQVLPCGDQVLPRGE